MTSEGRAPEQVTVRVVHASPGRLRVKVERRAWQSAALQRAEKNLAAVTGVLDVHRNPAALSILVQYDTGTASLPAMFAAVASAGVVIARPDATTNTTDRQTALTTEVTGLTAQADQWVAKRTGHRADLRTLVPIGFAALALREVVAGRRTAVPWYALAWYAFDIFYKFRRSNSSGRER